MEHQLARDIINDHFGPEVLQVAELLIQRFPGYAALPTIAAHCAPILPASARRALLLLLRHNLVDVKKKAPEGGSLSSSYVYAIKLDRVTGRLHFPAYCEQARKLFGDIGAELAFELTVHGQQTSSELHESVTSALGCSFAEARKVMSAMVGRGFMARASLWTRREAELDVEVALAKKAAEELAKKTSRGTSSSFANPSSLALSAAAGVSKKRKGAVASSAKPEGEAKRGRADDLPPEMKFMMLEATLADKSSKGGAEKGTVPSAPSSSSSTKTAVSKKRRDNNDDEDNGSELVVWMLGNDAFNLQFKHEEVVTIVEKKFSSPDATKIVRCMLKQSAFHAPQAAQAHLSHAVSTQEVFDELGLKSETAIGRRSLIAFLAMLEGDTLGIVRKIHGVTETKYAVNVTGIMDFIRQRALHHILMERYETGDLASHGVCARIYQVLRKVKYAEQNQIAELALMPMRETRTHLYKMFKDKYITYQEVPKRDHGPETTIFLWCINEKGDGKNAVVVDDMFKTILNLRRRRRVEAAKHRDLLIGVNDGVATVTRQSLHVMNHLDLAAAKTSRMLRLYSC